MSHPTIRTRRYVWLLVVVGLALGLALRAETVPAQTVTVVSFRSLGTFAGRPYVEVQATLAGSVARQGRPQGYYQVPVTLAYPLAAEDCNGVGFLDVLNSVFFEAFPTDTNPGDVLPLGRIFLGDQFLFERGYVYAAVQWNKLVTDRVPGWGTIEQGTDGYTILTDTVHFLRSPVAAFQGTRVPPPCRVPNVIAYGDSQTGELLRYLYHPSANVPGRVNLAEVLDGAVIGSAGARCRTLEDAAPLYLYFDCPGALRPVNKQLALNTESDVELFAAWAARGETSQYRDYELAGVAHLPGSHNPPSGFDLTALGATRQNPVDFDAALRAVVEHLAQWIMTGTLPPPSVTLAGSVLTFQHQPLFAANTPVAGNQFFCFVRDAAGNAQGGVRLPHIEAPLGTYRGIEYGPSFDPQAVNCPARIDPSSLPNFFAMLGGIFLPFSGAELQARYPNHRAYVSAVANAANASLQQGWILPQDRDAYIQTAASASIGNPQAVQ